MRKLSVAFLTTAFTLLLLVLVSSTPAYTAYVRDTCSCTAADGSCSASVTCKGGCTKYCGNNDNCYASCSGAYEFLQIEVTFEVVNGNYPQVVAELARVSGKEIAFTARNPEAGFNAGFKRATVWDALELLAERGTVQVAGQDFERLQKLRRSLLGGEKFSFCVKNTTVGTFVSDIAAVTGLPLRVTGGRPGATINLQLQNVALSDMLAAVSEQTGTRIMEVGPDSTGR